MTSSEGCSLENILRTPQAFPVFWAAVFNWHVLLTCSCDILQCLCKELEDPRISSTISNCLPHHSYPHALQSKPYMSNAAEVHEGGHHICGQFQQADKHLQNRNCLQRGKAEHSVTGSMGRVSVALTFKALASRNCV